MNDKNPEPKLLSTISKKQSTTSATNQILEYKEVTITSDNLDKCKKILMELWKND